MFEVLRYRIPGQILDLRKLWDSAMVDEHLLDHQISQLRIAVAAVPELEAVEIGDQALPSFEFTDGAAAQSIEEKCPVLPDQIY